LSGDKRAWDAFVDRFAPVIYAAVERTAGDRLPEPGASGAEDIVQNVFVRLLANDCRLLRAFDPARASLATYLTIIARSAALDHLRKRRPETAPLEGQEPAAPAAEDAGPPAVEIPAGLLTERQRLVLHMLFDRQMSVEEVSRILGIDAQTVRSTRHKALARLREHFDTG
jgi:RNA polymerase sigma-70 factor (ECF subfamily)